jgi:Putative phage tail protein
MATVVLTAVGAVFGGPVGAAIGLAAGIAIDSELAQQGTREGPRLGDLRVQTSRYGSPIPKLFGRCRVSGTVIWSTDLIETRSTQSNGKGKGATANYSYAASFAVLLSAREALRVERIWADGNLLRGAAGDFKTATGFRLLKGDEDQLIDPLIAAAEGIAMTPAYRGRTIAMFEDFKLAAYGNRIPTLSFEVVADEAAISGPALIDELTERQVIGGGEAVIDGIAITGTTVRGVAAALAEALPLSLCDKGTAIEVISGVAPSRAIAAGDLGAGAGDRSSGRVSETRGAALRVPEALSISYYDGARDYQPGVQRARRDGGARREDAISLAAVMGAGTAKALVEARLTTMWRERRQIVISLPWRAIGLRPGDRVTLPGEAGVWRIAALALERMVVRLTLVPVTAGSIVSRAADAGRNLAQDDRPHGPTTLVLLDLPALGDIADSVPRVAVAANGASAGWRGAPLLASADGGTNFIAIGATALPATMGRTIGALGPASAALIDRANRIDIQMINGAMPLSDADMAALISGANLAMIGAEAIQFGRAQPLSNGRWRLSELWRGRRGTELAIAGHGTNETFVLIEEAALAGVPAGLAVSGLEVYATGVGDGAAGTSIILGSAGFALTPLAPVHVRAQRRSDGGFDVHWVRRSREGWRWTDGVDVALGEERAAFRIVRSGAGLATIKAETDSSPWHYPAGQVAADIAAGATSVGLSIAQIGTRRASRPTAMTISLT